MACKSCGSTFEKGHSLEKLGTCRDCFWGSLFSALLFNGMSQFGVGGYFTKYLGVVMLLLLGAHIVAFAVRRLVAQKA
jgi:hypothetical protein